jgi:microcystin-dependent protein
VANPFLAEIRIFPFNFAPLGWAFCDGQLLSISQNTALFSLLGTSYGGNGTSNFALPNLQGNLPLGAGNGAGLSPYVLGQTGGSANVLLLQAEVPTHTHALMASANPATTGAPQNAVLATTDPSNPIYVPAVSGSPPTLAFGNSNEGPPLAVAGSSVPHNNLQPYLVVNFCIALQGVYPPRT